ncbi:MAG: SCO family protein [Gammaproteobacteria bacterium]|nr:SCO family protein [Gammaproteobacteria bacterium]
MISKPKTFDNASALKVSQAVIGNTIGEYVLVGRTGESVKLSDYLGKPLLISFIYTSCYHVCPTATRHLAQAVNKARDVLGKDSFNVLTIGFDTPNDTSDAMREFARQQGINQPGWKFLSGDQKTIGRLVNEVGFLYFSSPNGFDHLLQATLVDGAGKVYRQIYGINGTRSDTPRLVEPLKELVLGTPKSDSLLTTLANRIRLFCTVYDPGSDRYYFDYSLFVGVFIGAIILISMLFWLVREWRGQRRNGT